MARPINHKALARYIRVIEGRTNRDGEFAFVEELLDRHPKLAKCRLPNGQLPLRILLMNSRAALFHLLVRHRAEHDIFTACAATDAAAVERLLQQDPQLVLATDEDGNTPLHWACNVNFAVLPRDETQLVQMLLDRGANADAKNSSGVTPLTNAFLYGKCETIELLAQHSEKPDFLFCVWVQDSDWLDLLLKESPQVIHWRGPRGRSLLHFAIEYNARPEFVEYLLSKGASEDIESRAGRNTPLLKAIRENPDVAEVLVKHGAEVNVRQLAGRGYPPLSALGLAVVEDRPGVVDMLLAHGADIHMELPDGRSLLHYAQSDEIAERLIGAGLDVNAKDNFGQSALDFAIGDGERNVAATLLRHGASGSIFVYAALGDRTRVMEMLDRDPSLIAAHCGRGLISTVSSNGEDSVVVPCETVSGTALHYAARAGVLGMVELLLARGAAVDATTEPTQWTPLHDATYYGIIRDARDAEAIIRRLVAAGADLRAKTGNGFCPLDIARYLSSYDRSADVFDLLLKLGRNS